MCRIVDSPSLRHTLPSVLKHLRHPTKESPFHLAHKTIPPNTFNQDRHRHSSHHIVVHRLLLSLTEQTLLLLPNDTYVLNATRAFRGPVVYGFTHSVTPAKNHSSVPNQDVQNDFQSGVICDDT